MTRVAERLLWLTTTLAIVGGAIGASPRRPAFAGGAWVAPSAVTRDTGSREATSPSDLARRLTATDPFRLERRPASVPFGVEPPPAMVASRPARPALRITGVAGPPWQAVLEGVPGREQGVLVRAGERVQELDIRSVRGDTVVVAGMDTLWILTVRRSW